MNKDLILELQQDQIRLLQKQESHDKQIIAQQYDIIEAQKVLIEKISEHNAALEQLVLALQDQLEKYQPSNG
jgi:hypothetical protein